MLAFDLRRRDFFNPEISKREIDEHTKVWDGRLNTAQILNDIGYETSFLDEGKTGEQDYKEHKIEAVLANSGKTVIGKGKNVVDALNNFVKNCG